MAVPCLLLSGCAGDADPAEGGFIEGVGGLVGGGYQRRIDAREAAVDDATMRGETLSAAQQQAAAEQARLDAEIADLEDEHASLKASIVRLRAEIAASGSAIDTATEREIDDALASTPDSSDVNARALALRAAVLKSRRLVDSLSQLATAG